jgi:hypothetical protein
MPNFNSRIDGFLLESQVLIDNAISNEEIFKAMAEYGYSKDKLTYAKTLQEEVVKLHNKQKKEYGEQIESTGELDKAQTKANKAYMKSLKIAREALQNHPKSAALMLHGERKQTIAGWLEQADAFYTNLTGDNALLTEMSDVGYSKAKLETEYALVKDVTAKAAAQKKETGEAQESTEKRDVKMNELDKWVSKYRNIARVVFEDDSQKLEQLGILAR